ncbi:MAG: hypothetical protein IJF09_01770 [Ruminiclostridium sp.]|nr:hypothetical protein [Ruminiclostridium sp.]
MKALKTILATIIAISSVISLTGCTEENTSSVTSGNSSVTSSDTMSETTSSTDESKNTESDNGSTANSSDTSSEEEVQLVKDGKFVLPNGKLSFALQEDYTLVSDAIVYQFGCESSNNKFNLTVSTATENIEDVDQDEMTKTYETTMQDFKLVSFEHIKVKEKSAIKMQLTGKLYGIEGETMLTQYMIQSGTDAYCFTFTQTDYYNKFPDIIEATIDSLEIK